jgi:hypothetical protein
MQASNNAHAEGFTILPNAGLQGPLMMLAMAPCLQSLRVKVLIDVEELAYIGSIQIGESTMQLKPHCLHIDDFKAINAMRAIVRDSLLTGIKKPSPQTGEAKGEAGGCEITSIWHSLLATVAARNVGQQGLEHDMVRPDPPSHPRRSVKPMSLRSLSES